MKRYLYAAALAAIGIGVALVYAGVIAKGMILPGAVLIGVGILVAAAAAIVDIAMPDRTGAAADDVV